MSAASFQFHRIWLKAWYQVSGEEALRGLEHPSRDRSRAGGKVKSSCQHTEKISQGRLIPVQFTVLQIPTSTKRANLVQPFAQALQKFTQPVCPWVGYFLPAFAANIDRSTQARFHSLCLLRAFLRSIGGFLHISTVGEGSYEGIQRVH